MATDTGGRGGLLGRKPPILPSPLLLLLLPPPLPQLQMLLPVLPLPLSLPHLLQLR